MFRGEMSSTHFLDSLESAKHHRGKYRFSREKKRQRNIFGYIRKELIHFAYTYNIYHRVNTQAHYINTQCIFRPVLKFAKFLSRYLRMYISRR